MTVVYLNPPESGPAAAPPHNEVAEQALIGALMLFPAALGRVSRFLKPEHFYYPAHAAIFARILDDRARGMSADVITLQAWAAAAPELRPIGGPRYLAELSGGLFAVTSLADYAGAILDCWRQRQTAALFRQLAADAAATDRAPEFVAAASEQIRALERSIAVSRPPAIGDQATALQEYLDAPAGYGFVRTGLTELDGFTGGIAPGEQVIVGAATSMGKTAFAGTVALNAAREESDSGERGAIVFVTLEMSDQRILLRLVSNLSSVPAWKLRRKALGLFERQAAIEALNDVRRLPIIILHRPGLTLARWRADLDVIARDRLIRLVVVDYVQLMLGDAAGDNRASSLGRIANGIKETAEERGFGAMVLAQLSRQVGARDNKRPMLSDLRDSGELEQSADQAWFLHREEYYLERAKPPSDDTVATLKWGEAVGRARGLAEIIVGKNRDGPTGTKTVGFSGDVGRFYDTQQPEQ